MVYADDTQVYIILNESDRALVMPNLEKCIHDIKLWSTKNDLKLNEDKTQVLHLTSRFRNSSPITSVNVCGTSVLPVVSARNLGVIVQSDLKMDSFVNNICRSASFSLYKIGQIRKYLDTKSTELLVHALIISHLDQCNSLLYGLPEIQLNKLQRIQNSAARLITLTRKYDHITPILHKLHWLPIKYRVIYKVLLITFKCLHEFAPIYLQELVKQYTPTRNLRSSSQVLLTPPLVSTQYGRRAFSFAAAELWNNLPPHLRHIPTMNQFKSSLKTYLFDLAF